MRHFGSDSTIDIEDDIKPGHGRVGFCWDGTWIGWEAFGVLANLRTA